MFITGGSLSVAILGVIALCVFGVYKFLIYPVFISPLARIPNAHPTCSFSPVWILWTRYHARENKAVFDAHQKLGPVVRLGPMELSVCCIDGGLRTIYGGGFDKPDWYQAFRNHGVDNMFSTKYGKPHSAIRKLVSHVYSKTSISSSPAVHSQTASILYTRFLPLLNAQAESKKSMEVVELYFANTMDFITAFIFGLRSSTNFLGDKKARKRFLEIYAIKRSADLWTQEFPGITYLARTLGIDLKRNAVEKASTELDGWNLKMCNAASDILSTTRLPRDEPVVYGSLKSHGEKERSRPTSLLNNTYLADPALGFASEVFDHLVAGFETSGITLTYLTYELSRKPILQAKLRAELLTLKSPFLFPAPSCSGDEEGPLPDYKELDALPVLHAVLLETLRLYTAIPGPQPRVTPVVANGITLGTGGHVYRGIPGGVRVQASAYTLHRNSVAFPEPEEFKYERWLVPTSESKSDSDVTKERAYWAFGSGGRMCVGSNFAIHELKMVVAAIYTNFVTSIVDDEGIEQLDGYITGPRSGRLFLRFEKAR